MGQIKFGNIILLRVYAPIRYDLETGLKHKSGKKHQFDSILIDLKMTLKYFKTMLSHILVKVKKIIDLLGYKIRLARFRSMCRVVFNRFKVTLIQYSTGEVNKNELKEYTDWLITNRKLGFSAVSRSECAKITIEWLEEFERVLRHKKITEILRKETYEDVFITDPGL